MNRPERVGSSPTPWKDGAPQRPVFSSEPSALFVSPGRIIRSLFLPLLLVPPPARAEAVLDVSGSIASVSPKLEVRVVIANRGDRRAAPIDLAGDLLGERCERRFSAGVGPGREATVVLEFSPVSPRQGTHALTLLLEHPVEGT